MKTIALMPVRNEAWILPYTLETLSRFCDAIIVSDQHSTDGTQNICRQFEKVWLLQNDHTGHSNQVRWQLLDAAREIPGNNLLLNIDADELIPPALFEMFLENHQDALQPGTWLSFWWVQLWKSRNTYRDDDSVWSNLWKPIGFVDDRSLDYNRDQVVMNDHTARVPGPPDTPVFQVVDVPLLHLQWVSWHKTQVKQAWYRCTEFLNDSHQALAINQRYAITLDDPTERLSEVPSEWLLDLSLPPDLEMAASTWHLAEIMHWMDTYGVLFFEPLQIWHIEPLRERFVLEMKREPLPMLAEPSKTLVTKVTKELDRLKRRLRG